jgi:hypothetical protein
MVKDRSSSKFLSAYLFAVFKELSTVPWLVKPHHNTQFKSYPLVTKKPFPEQHLGGFVLAFESTTST